MTDYRELFRPRFHFTAERNWLNDPNGLVWHDGEYHLFFQYNAVGLTWGPNSWGHAVSSDLVHWRQLPDALDPDEQFGWIWSGSAVFDRHNTSGLGVDGKPPLVAMYTTGSPPRGLPVVQCIASSTDRGRTWTKFPGNPVIPFIEGENRDPKVIWHTATKQWMMSVYLARNDFALFSSPDLKQWKGLNTVQVDRCTECPDLFELPIDGDAKRTAWVLWTADGGYRLGTLDATGFHPTSPTLFSEFGANGYAAQTWVDAPDGRCLQISWMRGGRYPSMAFNQQMSFPLELSLRTFPEGVRLCRVPAREIASLHGRAQTWAKHRLIPGAPLQAVSQVGQTPGEGVWDLTLTVEPRSGEAIVCRIHGHDMRYRPGAGVLSFLGRDLPVPLQEGRCTLRVLIDRTSVEIIARDGAVVGSFCYLPEACNAPLEVSAHGGEMTIDLDVREMRSARESTSNASAR